MKKIQTITMMLLLLASTFSFAQTGVNVTYYDGNLQSFNVTQAGKLYFDADNLYVKADGTATPTTIPVSIIRKITFSGALATSTFGTNADNLVLYPNPGADAVRIDSNGTKDIDTKIYSLTGQLVLQGTYKPGEDINVSSLSPGLYLVQANGVTIKFSKK